MHPKRNVRGRHVAKPDEEASRRPARASLVSSAVLVACFSLLLTCTLGAKVLDVAGLPLPAPFNSSGNPAKIEGRSNSQALSLRSALNIQGLLSGDLQDAVSQKIGDAFPLRDEGLLVYGGFQRGLIGIGNAFTSYPITPAYYGSAYAINWPQDAVVLIASKVSEENLAGMRAVATAVNAAQESHPNVRFVYDQLWDMYSSDMNPTYPLLTGAYSKSDFDENLGNLLDERVRVVWDPIASPEELEGEWLHTEHHWTLERALESYERIGALLGWKEVPYEGAVEVSGGWYGANARHALYLGFDDELWDLPTDFSHLVVRDADGKEVLRGARNQIAAGVKPSNWGGPYDGYDSWYGPSGEFVYTNEDGGNGKTCLVVGLSYEKPIDPYIASNYQTTVCLDVVNVGTRKPLQEYLDEYGVDDVVFQLGLGGYKPMMEKSAGFLGLDSN